MPHHAYIDEAGTQEDQQIMTVALVVLDGARSAARLHLKLSKAIFSDARFKGLAAKEKFHASQKLHYYLISHDHKLALGAELAKANVRAIVAHYAHTEKSATHEHRFSMYQALVQAVVRRAFQTYDELVVSVGKQGGFEDYGPALIGNLKSVLGEVRSRERFCKGDFFLSSAAKPGQQIADFYASASRHYLLASIGQHDLPGPFERVIHQVLSIEELKEAELLLKEK